jgi:hypothetical protein
MLDCKTLEVDKEPEKRLLAEKDARDTDVEGEDEVSTDEGEDDEARGEELIDCGTLEIDEELVPLVMLDGALLRTLLLLCTLLLASEDDGNDVATLGEEEGADERLETDEL